MSDAAFRCDISINAPYSANKFAVTGANEFANTEQPNNVKIKAPHSNKK
jgi:hypothetical protein